MKVINQRRQFKELLQQLYLSEIQISPVVDVLTKSACLGKMFGVMFFKDSFTGQV